MNMRVDVVAAPVRYRRGPLMMLLVVAVVPALGLFAAQDWLDEEADRYESTRDEVETVSATGPSRGSLSDLERAEQLAVLPAPLLSYRRLPDAVSVGANANRLRDDLADMFDLIDSNSCAAVSVNGVDAGSANPTASVMPATTVQLITGAVALDVLGDEYIFETTVRVSEVVDGVVQGDIYLVGGGDPMLTSDDYPIDDDAYPPSATTSLDALADAVVDAGIERINGAVVGDGSRYDDEFFVADWADEVFFFEQAGPIDSLLVNDARVRGRSGVENDPNQAAAREFVRLLGNRGVQVNNGWTSGEASLLTREIARIESSPLAEIVGDMVATNDSNTAEMLLKEIGFADSGHGARTAGLVVVDRTLASWGVSLAGVRITDGSGLSPNNRITCPALLKVLQHARGTVIATALSVAGETGTLAEEFTDSPLRGRLLAATGNLVNPPDDELPLSAKALAGYVPDDDVGAVEFVLILNDAAIDSQSYELMWAGFAEQLATFPAYGAVGDFAVETES